MQKGSCEFLPDSVKLNEAETSLFSAGDYQIMASDCVETITTPAAQRESLNEAIALEFDRLRKQGVDNPVIMGAIPFDISQASSLKVYGHYRKTPRASLDGAAQDGFAIKNTKRITSEDQFKHCVKTALAEFDAQRMEKIVLSQSLEVELGQSQSALQLAQNLMKKNPRAYTFAMPVAGDQVLVGASPELLLSRQGKSVISNPLAGSAKRTGDEQQDSHSISLLKQSPKDKHEHRFVVDYIARHLAPYCSGLSISEDPHVLETPTMLHLSSLFEGQLRGDAPDALNLALELHPTPAVCGTPMELAKRFIIENEGYDRHYYTGLVGWMDAEGNGEWVVTIRCGLLCDDRIRLYAGAGIVKGSDADAEWRETESKQRTMLDVFSAP